jgi:hypothetical protein
MRVSALLRASKLTDVLNSMSDSMSGWKSAMEFLRACGSRRFLMAYMRSLVCASDPYIWMKALPVFMFISSLWASLHALMASV